MAATPTPAARPNEGPQAALRFARAPDGQSYIARQRVGYPFHITRPFYFDEAPAGALTLYLQSVSGGIYQGEDLRMTCSAEACSAAHVTTQAATIVHRMPAAPARQTVALEAADGALLEYLPDPLIMFPGARLTSVLEIEAAEGATVIACESFAHHDPGGEDRRFESFEAEMRIRDEGGRLLALERYVLAGDRLAEGASQIARWPAQGSVVVAHRGPAREAILAALRSALAPTESFYGGASALPNEAGVGVRLLARDGARLYGAGWRQRGAQSGSRSTAHRPPAAASEPGPRSQHALDIGSRKIRADIEQEAIARLCNFIGKAVAKVQARGVDAFAPSRVAARHAPRHGQRHVFDLQAEPIDERGHFDAETSPLCDNQCLGDGSGGHHDRIV